MAPRSSNSSAITQTQTPPKRAIRIIFPISQIFDTTCKASSYYLQPYHTLHYESLLQVCCCSYSIDLLLRGRGIHRWYANVFSWSNHPCKSPLKTRCSLLIPLKIESTYIIPSTPVVPHLNTTQGFWMGLEPNNIAAVLQNVVGNTGATEGEWGFWPEYCCE